MPSTNSHLTKVRTLVDFFFSIIALFTVVFGLASCKMAAPFRGPITETSQFAPDETALIALTYVKTGTDSAKNKVFWEQVMKVDAAVPMQAGYLGHSIRRVVMGEEGWTMTVWANEQSLNAFVRGEAHQTAIAKSINAVVAGRFARITVKRSEIPISWTKAEQILKEQGRDLYQ
jgi:heme-degrading monooxygenase HmoA